MKFALLDISNKLDEPTIELYRAVDNAVHTIGANYLIVGASARDLIFLHGFGLTVVRATGDIDYGIQLEGWGQFEKLKKVLVDEGFKQDKSTHRLISPNDMKLDVVPFGGVEEPGAKIRWPPKHDFEMNVLGFKEALESAIPVQISDAPKLAIPVASPEGFALLKLIAWTDREKRTRRKDAQDLIYAAKSFDKVIGDTVYDDETVLAEHDFDVARVGAHLLGRKIAQISALDCRSYLSRFFAGDLPLLDVNTLVDESLENPFSPREENEGLINAMMKGYLEYIEL